MILNQLTLQNFCVYKGLQTIDLRPANKNGKHRPIVLFGGVNGGGKTTILDAIQLVLYGNRATCSKKSEKTYEQFLRESIHRDVPPSQGASICLSFQYATDGQQSTFDVLRQWTMKGSKIKETVIVQKNGGTDRWLSENWAQQVEDLLPQGISQLCFFDAEKIRFLAEDETSNATLGSAIKALLGLDLAERLISDVIVLETRIAKRTKQNSDLCNLELLETAVAEKSVEVNKFIQDLAQLENSKQVIAKRLTQAERSFEATGGEHWKKRQDRQHDLATAEGKLAAVKSQLIELSSGELPLLLNSSLISSLKNRLSSNKGYRNAAILEELLISRDAKLVDTLESSGLEENTINLVKRLLEQDRSGRKLPVEQIDFHIELSGSGETLLNGINEGLLSSRRELVAKLVDTAKNLSHEIEDLQRALAATPKDSIIKGASDVLKKAVQEAALIDQQAKAVDDLLTTARQERSLLDDKLKKERKRIADEQIADEEDQRILRLLSRTQETMQEFLKRSTENKIGRLSEYITESFRFLLRKKELVSRVVIDPTTFSIELEDKDGRRISKQQLSEGEKQIFAVSVLWGLSRASARPLPAVIDTPMGRLDAEHRLALLERYFPNASHQVIILSTDTEIEENAVQKLTPSIARSYHLSYDDLGKCTTALEGYFWQPT
jgi:DNA sulfur modification protein DndD